MDDLQLLREYVRGRSQEAFRELVARHLPMVCSAARRMVRDDHLAEDVAQEVFVTLVQKASALGATPVVGGWLYNTTRHLAMHAVRTEQRRRQREQAAVAMQPLPTADETGHILEQLEPAMTELDDAERDVLVLRYFEDRSLHEVGQELGISEEAARKRVDRALERLRTVFAAQGITVTTLLLATVLAASTTTAVPAGLSAAIMAAAPAGISAAATTATQGILMSMFSAKTMAAAAGAALLAGTGIYLVQQRQIQRLEGDNQDLLAQRQQLAAEGETAAKAAQTAKGELARLQNDKAELLRLRSEVGQLRRERAAQTRAGQQVPLLAAAEQLAANPGRYISRDQLAFAGYATPEAAAESMVWATVTGSEEQVGNSAAPAAGGQEEAAVKQKLRETAPSRKSIALGLKGIQIMARKVLAEGGVELKLRLDLDSGTNGSVEVPPVLIAGMVKVGDGWKWGEDRAAEDGWDQDGQVQVLAQ
jgi:RNA polymerase sigma factor (sigma-70 family)